MAKAKKAVEDIQDAPVEAKTSKSNYVVTNPDGVSGFIDAQTGNTYRQFGSEYSGTDSDRIAHLEKLGLIKKA